MKEYLKIGKVLTGKREVNALSQLILERKRTASGDYKWCRTCLCIYIIF